MMEEWGVPTFYLQSMAYECAKRLATRGEWTPDLAMAGGFSTEDHIFKVLAMGAPYFKAVCMGRALMIPGFVGSNIEGVVGDGVAPGSVEGTAHAGQEVRPDPGGDLRHLLHPQGQVRRPRWTGCPSAQSPSTPSSTSCAPV